MKFEEVLPALREGKKIRCKNWNNDYYIYLNRCNNILDQNNNLEKELCVFLINGNWEIVEEEKVKYYPALVRWSDEKRIFIDAQESAKFKSKEDALIYYSHLECKRRGDCPYLLFIHLAKEIPELIEERDE